MYKSFYRVYRPKKLQDVVGQNHIVQTLTNAIQKDKINHAYLFAGPRGTGKTSLARVFAQTVNCSILGQNDENFQNCLINKKFSSDIIEIDAASNNGVAEIRNLIESANYVPNEAKYKFYIVDEAHMLTKGAFNAFLKILEEPPAHTVFILATTEPNKIPLTVLSRLQRFNFHRINLDAMSQVVANVLKLEKIEFEDKAISLINKISQGSLRDALSLVEQVSNFSSEKITVENTIKALNIVSTQDLISLLNYAFNKNSKDLITKINFYLSNGVDIFVCFEMLLNILRDFIIYKSTKDLSLLTFIEENDLELIDFNQEFAYNSSNIIFDNINQINANVYDQQVFEFTMLKISQQHLAQTEPEARKTLNLKETNNFDSSSEVKNSDEESKVNLEKEKSTTKTANESEQKEISIDDLAEEFFDEGSENLDDSSKQEQTPSNEIRLETDPEIMNNISVAKQSILLDPDFPTDGSPYKLTEEFELNNDPIEVDDVKKEEKDPSDGDSSGVDSSDSLDFDDDEIRSYSKNDLHELRSLEDQIYVDTPEFNYDQNIDSTQPVQSKVEKGKVASADEIEKDYHDQSFHQRLMDLSDVVKNKKEVEEDKNSEQNNSTAKKKSLFDFEDGDSPSQKVETINSVDQIVNLLVIANKVEYENLKQSFLKIGKAKYSQDLALYVELLKSVKPITGSNEFLLLASDDQLVVNNFKTVLFEKEFQNLIKTIFKKLIKIFVISKNEFSEAKTKWFKLKEANKLPTLKKLNDIKLK